MATVLFTWELGGGLGHMFQLLPLAEGLVGRGHRVFVALRNLADAATVFGRSGVSFLPAPHKSGGHVYSHRTLNYAHVLANIGWGSYGELFGLGSAWRNILEFVRPDLIIFDHSPTALLASRYFRDVRRVVIGSGFLCPPDARPFPPFRPPEQIDMARLMADEDHLVCHANRLLQHWGQPPLDRLAQVYSEVDETFLVTFPELDHYGERHGVRYWGPINGPGGANPAWPQAPGHDASKRVYAYLKKSPALPALLETLAQRGYSAIIFTDGIDGDTRRQFTSGTMRFCDGRLDLAQVGRKCDVAVHNANHGTLSELLLAGCPMLQLPITVEQQILARRVCQLGAAEAIPLNITSAAEIGSKLDAVLGNAAYRAQARQFAERHRDFDRARQQQDLLERVEMILNAPKSFFL